MFPFGKPTAFSHDFIKVVPGEKPGANVEGDALSEDSQEALSLGSYFFINVLVHVEVTGDKNKIVGKAVQQDRNEQQRENIIEYSSTGKLAGGG